MKEVSRHTVEFLSDDGRLGMFVELEDGVAARITLSKKTGPKVEFAPKDLPGLSEVIVAANKLVNPVAEG